MSEGPNWSVRCANGHDLDLVSARKASLPSAV